MVRTHLVKLMHIHGFHGNHKTFAVKQLVQLALATQH